MLESGSFRTEIDIDSHHRLDLKSIFITRLHDRERTFRPFRTRGQSHRFTTGMGNVTHRNNLMKLDWADSIPNKVIALAELIRLHRPSRSLHEVKALVALCGALFELLDVERDPAGEVECLCWLAWDVSSHCEGERRGRETMSEVVDELI